MHTELLEFLSKCFLLVCCVTSVSRFKVVFLVTHTNTHTKSHMHTGLHTYKHHTHSERVKKKTKKLRICSACGTYITLIVFRIRFVFAAFPFIQQQLISSSQTATVTQSGANTWSQRAMTSEYKTKRERGGEESRRVGWESRKFEWLIKAGVFKVLFTVTQEVVQWVGVGGGGPCGYVETGEPQKLVRTGNEALMGEQRQNEGPSLWICTQDQPRRASQKLHRKTHLNVII